MNPFPRNPSPLVAARRAKLRYVSGHEPGFRRVRNGRSFRYLAPNGRAVTGTHLRRIAHLAIPPAWREVWICRWPDGHLQAIGCDARGRKQYRYHDDWRTERDRTKFAHMDAFARALPLIRRRVAQDLRGPPLARSTVLATLVRLLDTTLIRIGNEEYARRNHSFGLSTLRHNHVSVGREKLRFHFRGKSGREHELEVQDRRVAGIVRRLEDLPGQELFQYVDEHGRRRNLGSADVNAYLHEIAGAEVTAKDFRTWAATLEAAHRLALVASGGRQRTKARVTEMIAAVAAHLGNTPAICRKCYIHPGLIDAYLAGTVLDFPSAKTRAGQAAVLRLLRAASRLGGRKPARPA